jgi:hypothetical protein
MDDRHTCSLCGSSRINTKFYSKVYMAQTTRYTGENNIRMDLKATVYEGMVGFHPAHYRS